MKPTISSKIYLVLVLISMFSPCICQSHELLLVKNGKANSVIVVPENISALQQLAVNEFYKTIYRSSGAKIPVITERKLLLISESTVKIVIGPSHLTDSILGTTYILRAEEFRIISKDNYLLVLAKDIRSKNFKYSSQVTTWALDYLLENYLNVKWLWPGELGTVVPKFRTIKIPEINIAKQQVLEKRKFRISSNLNLVQWCAHQQVIGERKSYNIRHAFTDNTNNGDWWVKFSKTHPDYLAKNPAGEVSLRDERRPTFFKLDVSNPEVIKEIVKTWKEAGKPDFWNVAPNDGGGYCTCDNCLKIDRIYGKVEYTKKDIWFSKAEMTDRYVWFWNKLITEMRKENPNVKIGTYFYSAFRNPPKIQKLEPGIIGGLVSGFDFSKWEAWNKAGASGIAFRPNWWHMGGNGPYLPLRLAGSFVDKARKHKMIYIDMDSMMEYWATQGPYYYLVARLVARPDLDVEDIITEYCDAFGAASQEIRRYLNYWEEYGEKVAYNIPAGGKLSQDTSGIYETVSREHFGSVMHPLNGHWRTMPYIYTDEVMSVAYKILDEATKKADDSEGKKRIDFLRDGLNQVVKVSKVVSVDDSEKVEALKELVSFSNRMEKKYGYWGSNGISVMRNRGVIGKEIDLDDM